MSMRSLSLLPRCLTFCLALRRVERLNPKWSKTRCYFVAGSSLSTLNSKLTRFVATRGFYSASKFLSVKHVAINMPPKRGRPAKGASKSKAGTSQVADKLKSTLAKKTKRASSEDGESGEEPAPKKAKVETKKDKVETKKAKVETKKAAPMNKTDSNLNEIDFGCTRENAKGQTFNLKICSWNVSGIRACIKKNALDYLLKEDADIIALQETKCDKEKLPEEVKLDGYHEYFVDSKKAGYCGVALYAKVKPSDVKFGLNNKTHDEEGRIITAEFENYYVVSVYVPNAGQKLVTLPKRLQWNKDFKEFIKELDKKKPVIICGDMNVAHTEIDLKNPKTNTKNAGFTKEERDDMTDFLSVGFVDTFRQLYPDKIDAYTFWAYFGNARSKNIGWRIDYFLVSEAIKDNVCDNVIRDQIFGSDHCPIVLYINL